MIRASARTLVLAGSARPATENLVPECLLKAPPWRTAECCSYDPQQEKGRQK
ncbi:MAG: hypothetical protein K0R64_1539 [Novosphingobium lindaniclasticum]|jgi:hypothetical protein|uniref:hypothetical protein n=1 Tax=Novosphingobium lindaniclasticum TaxID=1329895 RepID=UPI00240A0C6F|nr:hypothetical protein [Novosphingobium lindaniclasticum]MDF2638555.1 hypothetical protein [Novosphingobium lindaniclasticum]